MTNKHVVNPIIRVSLELILNKNQNRLVPDFVDIKIKDVFVRKSYLQRNSASSKLFLLYTWLCITCIWVFIRMYGQPQALKPQRFSPMGFGGIINTVSSLARTDGKRHEKIKLEQQDKKNKILMEQLSSLQNEHWKSMRKNREHLQLKGAANKIATSIRQKKTQTIQGKDMANFIEMLQLQEMFANKQKVEEAIFQRNKLVDELIEHFFNRLKQYKMQLQKLPTPERIPLIDPMKFTPIISSDLHSQVVVKDRIFTVKQGSEEYYPVFTEIPLLDGQTFQVEVVQSADRHFTVGVATIDLKKMINMQQSNKSFCISALGFLFSSLKPKNLNFTLTSGDRVSVLFSNNNVEWFNNKYPLCSMPLPKWLIKQQLFAVCWIRSQMAADSISKLRFI